MRGINIHFHFDAISIRLESDGTAGRFDHIDVVLNQLNAIAQWGENIRCR